MCGRVESFKPQLDICSFPRRILTPARVSLSRDFGGSRRDAQQDELRKNGKTRATLTLSKSFLIARVNSGGKMTQPPPILVRVDRMRCYYNYDDN